MVMSAEHENLVLLLYEHAGDEDMGAMFAPWSYVFGAAGLHALLIDPNGAVVDGAVVTLHDGQGSAPKEYEEEWRHADPRMGIAMAHLGEVLSDVDHIDPVAFERSDVYNAVMRPFDLRYSLFGNLQLAHGFVFGQAILRSKSQGPYVSEEVRAMARLVPHIRRAFDLRIELAAARTRAEGIASALDVMPSPVLVLDSLGRVLHHNEAAQTLLTAGDAVTIRQQRLAVRDPRAEAQLRNVIAQTIQYADQSSSAKRTHVTASTMVVEVPRRGRAAVTLVVHPIRPRLVLRSRSDPRARALVVFHDPEMRTSVDRSLLRHLHGLTQTEAELAAMLAEGKTLAEFATSRGCSETTARTHLKRVLEKTRTHRQAELVHRILASCALHVLRS